MQNTVKCVVLIFTSMDRYSQKKKVDSVPRLEEQYIKNRFMQAWN